MERIRSLDYLRGLMALSVMIYHYYWWSFGDPAPGGETLLGKLGIYAVSTFFILSGLSLALVYKNRITGGDAVVDFAIRRVFRIAPLYWLTITAALILGFGSKYIQGIEYEFPTYAALLNYSLTFGFLDHTAYLTTGAWSIGNEIVFYTIFPLVLVAARKFSLVLPTLLSLSIAIAVYFAFFHLDAEQEFSTQWAPYIHPLNQLFFFMAGVAIGFYEPKIRSMNWSVNVWLSILIMSCLLFWALPAQGDKIQIVTGSRRLILSGCCVAVVISILIINPTFRSLPTRVLGFLGESCYSIYLLHPVVAGPIVFVTDRYGVAPFLGYSLSFVITLAASWLSFRLIETPTMLAGKRVSLWFRSKPSISSGT